MPTYVGIVDGLNRRCKPVGPSHNVGPSGQKQLFSLSSWLWGETTSRQIHGIACFKHGEQPVGVSYEKFIGAYEVKQRGEPTQQFNRDDHIT